MPAEDQFEAPEPPAPKQPAEPAAAPAGWLPPQPPQTEPDLPAAVLGAEAPHPRRARLPIVAGVVLAVGLTVLLVGGAFLLRSGDGDSAVDDGPPWSAWRPSASGDGAADQIAARIGSRYRGSRGGQLVRVEGGPLEVAGLPLRVALREPGGAPGTVSVLAGETVLYRLCGSGPDCAISGGKPSFDRHLLLRREALELALYSLRYVDGVGQVVVFMPPRLGDQPSQALLFRRSAIGAELRKPLEATLVDRAPSVARVRKSPDAGLVQRLTLPALFRFSLTPARAGERALLVLEPFAAPAPAPAPRSQGLPNSSLS